MSTRLLNKRSTHVSNIQKWKTKERLVNLCGCRSQKLISPLPILPTSPNLCEHLPSCVVILQLNESEEAESGSTLPIQVCVAPRQSPLHKADTKKSHTPGEVVSCFPMLPAVPTQSHCSIRIAWRRQCLILYNIFWNVCLSAEIFFFQK